MADILIVEDTPSLMSVYRTMLSKAGYAVDVADTLASATDKLEKGRYRLALIDLMLPDGDGFDLLGLASRAGLETTMIVITSNGSINRAVEAMRAGAYDFLMKPFNEARLLTTVKNGLERVALQKAVAAVEASGRMDGFQGFIGSSLPMQALYRTIRNVATSKATVFITGESGTGKEVCAEALHRESRRSGGKFVALNCGAIPKDLLESEVFGHLKGAFTGAIADRKGAAELAHGGTLFLDEICEMEPALQTKLLRFLQTSTIQPVGSGATKKVDVRIVCATNRDPMAEVQAGRFREDLYYRLHVIPIQMPPLRDRDADVIEIAEAFLSAFGVEEGKAFDGLSVEAQDALLRHSWPGNVRELQNLMRQVAVLHPGGVVEADAVPIASRVPLAPGATPAARIGPAAAAAPAAPLAFGEGADVSARFVGRTLDSIEREVIEQTIARFSGSIPRAAKALGVSPSTIYRKREAWLATSE